MKRVFIAVVLVLLILSLPALLRKRRVNLVSNGKVAAVASLPSILPWEEGAYEVYEGKTKLFSLWGDYFDFPILILPFPDGKRYLCIYDYDVSVLVFVVDTGGAATNVTSVPHWPIDGYVRECLTQGMTNVVLSSKGSVRLPDLSEVQEASRMIRSMTPAQYRYGSFPSLDLGVRRWYWPQAKLLLDLETNRSSVWP